MRVLKYFTLFGLFGSLFAEESEVQEGKTIVTSQDGIYVGLGIVASNDKYDFSLNSFAHPEDNYKTTDYRRNQRNYNGQLFVGYQIVAPFFAALELSYTLNKASVGKRYDDTELPGGESLVHSAYLSMKYSNDLALKLKIGKSFSIGCGNSCRHITPYMVAGIHERSIDASFDYPALSKNVGDLAPDLTDFSYANHKMKNRKLGVVWGFGTSVAFEKGFSIGVEYNCRKMGSLHEQRILPKNPSGGNSIDKLATPRYYSINGENTHSLTVWLSKNL